MYDYSGYVLLSELAERSGISQERLYKIRGIETIKFGKNNAVRVTSDPMLALIAENCTDLENIYPLSEFNYNLSSSELDDIRTNKALCFDLYGVPVIKLPQNIAEQKKGMRRYAMCIGPSEDAEYYTTHYPISSNVIMGIY